MKKIKKPSYHQDSISADFNTLCFGMGSPESLSFSVNDAMVYEIMIEDDMKEFLRSFYFIMNVAVGGNWPGYPDNSTTFPQQMNIDYIRVFKRDGINLPEAPALDIEEENIGQNIEPSLAQMVIPV